MKKIIVLSLSLMLSWFIIGCTSSTEPNNSTVSDIEALIQAEDSLFTIDGFTDAQSDTFQFHYGRHHREQFHGPFLPWFIRRSVNSWNRNIDVQTITEDSAIVTMTMQVTGTFHIGINADTTNDTRVDTVWEKPFDVTAIRKVSVVRRQFPDWMSRHMGRRHNGWRIAGMTPMVSESAASDLTVSSLIIRDVTSGESLDIDDPLTTFLNWNSMPQFNAGDSIEVELTVTNGDNSGTTVLAQYRMAPRFGQMFTRLFDDGNAPDVTADDGTFSGGWTMARMPGMRHSVFEILDNTLLTDPDADYSAVIWSLPYLVRMRHMGGGMGM